MKAPTEHSRRRFGVLAFHLLVVSGLAACGNREPAPPAPYSSLAAPIEFSVAQIEYTDQSTLPADATFIDRRRSEDLAGQALSLLQQRLGAGGGQGLARVELLEASVIERPLETTEGFRGFFTREPSVELDADLTVRVTIVDGLGLAEAFAEAQVGRIRPVLEGTGTLSKEIGVDLVIFGILNQLDSALDQTVAENLQPFVLRL